MNARAMVMSDEDNVATALHDVVTGSTVELCGVGARVGESVRATEPIPFAHKLAIRPISRGETVVKYGSSIGVATAEVRLGQHVHVHNVRSVRGLASPTGAAGS